MIAESTQTAAAEARIGIHISIRKPIGCLRKNLHRGLGLETGSRSKTGRCG